VSPVPAQPKIYHITHVDNLAAIVNDRKLVSDGTMLERGGPNVTIGMSAIKKRRVEEIHVPCHPGTKVGDYVPFNFCPRSVMLYLIHCANHPDLTYRGGQEPIVHLEADLHEVVEWTESKDRQWAFSLSNAGSYYVELCEGLDQLHQINWAAVSETDFRSPEVKEGKQAEFLVHGSFPWKLVRRIGVYSASIKARAEASLEGATHRPPVEILRHWYY
jgi:ssDNA thymidine ADP-ribosyltransferase DarT-like protein